MEGVHLSDHTSTRQADDPQAHYVVHIIHARGCGKALHIAMERVLVTFGHQAGATHHIPDRGVADAVADTQHICPISSCISGGHFRARPHRPATEPAVWIAFHKLTDD